MDFFTITIILAIVGFIYLVNSAASRSIQAMAEPDKTLELLGSVKDQEFLKRCTAFENWLSHKGYLHECYLLFHHNKNEEAIQVSAWWSSKAKTWALLYYAKEKQSLDFVTSYADDKSITTGSSKDAVLLPNSPGSYLQAFTGLSYDQLYEKHLQARNCLEFTEKLVLEINKQNLVSEIKKSLRKQSNYIMSLPLWRFRGVYWYFVRRNTRVNKPLSTSAIPSDLEKLIFHLKENEIVGQIDIFPSQNKDAEYTLQMSIDGENSKILSLTKYHRKEALETAYQDSLRDGELYGQSKNELFLVTLSSSPKDIVFADKIKAALEEYTSE